MTMNCVTGIVYQLGLCLKVVRIVVVPQRNIETDEPVIFGLCDGHQQLLLPLLAQASFPEI